MWPSSMSTKQRDLTTRPLYVPSPQEVARDYKPTYAVFYNPGAMIPRVENVPLGMLTHDPRDHGALPHYLETRS